MGVSVLDAPILNAKNKQMWREKPKIFQKFDKKKAIC